MKNKQISLSKKGLLIFLLLVFCLLVVFILHQVVNSRPNFLNNCSEARVRRLTNIPQNSVYYRAELDKDHDGVACEA